jgi:predicted RNase H-like HicB family nuclease
MVTAQQPAGYITVTFVVRRDEETQIFASHCLELGVSSAGKDLDEAFEHIAEAACLYLDTLEEAGEIRRVFAERGITVTPGLPPEREVELRVHPDEYAVARNLPLPAVFAGA